jgi:hypothetical protein
MSIYDPPNSLQDPLPQSSECANANADVFPVHIASEYGKVPARNEAEQQLHSQIDQEDHEDEEEIRQRLEEWRAMAANLANGFTQMPNQVRTDPTLRSSEKNVYEHLLSYMWKREWCWPSQARIAQELGISRRTVIRACEVLYNRCYIEKWRRGLGRTNVYFVNPLAFVQSFKKADRGKGILLQANGPEQQTTVSTSPRPDILASYYECQNGTSRSDKMSHQEVPKCHTKNTEEEKEIKGKNRDSKISSDSKKGRAAATIRNDQARENEQQPNGVGTKNTEMVPYSSKSKSHISNQNQEQAAPPRTSEPVIEQPRTSGQAAAIAAETGIPVEHLQELGIETEPKKRPIPDFIVDRMTRYTTELGDSPRYVKSNTTRAAKLYYFGLDYMQEAQDDPEGWFIDMLSEAKQRAQRIPNVGKRTGNRVNRIPAFFACLENLFGFDDNEWAYIRSELPLLEPVYAK